MFCINMTEIWAVATVRFVLVFVKGRWQQQPVSPFTRKRIHYKEAFGVWSFTLINYNLWLDTREQAVGETIIGVVKNAL